MALVMVVAACSAGVGPLELRAPTPEGEAAAQCSALVAATPARVAGQGRRNVTPRSHYATAWGDPAIVLRCGGPKPASLRPTAQCFGVNGVGWFVSHDGAAVDPAQPVQGTLEFTTIGRSVYVEVTIPARYQPAADAVVDLATAIKGHTTLLRPCQ